MKENSHSDVSEISIKANTKLETLVNDPKNKVETRQTIEFGSLGSKKKCYFSKLWGFI